jgi:citrate lyase subunit beta / citryl-CoA lyase
VVTASFTPSASDIAFYEGLVAAYTEAAREGTGALRYRGLHIDKAHYDKAVMWLRNARAIKDADENGEQQ